MAMHIHAMTEDAHVLVCACVSIRQDRWVQLAGEESGELRVRLVVVPGSTGSTAVQQMVALLSSEAFASASTSTLQVRWCTHA